MTPERWKKLDALFHEALELQGEARAAHLALGCGDDVQLRAEAEKLLAAHEREGSFIDSPILAEAAELANDGNESPVGRSIGHYQVVSLLGRGGMGEVYLAEDSRLERKVALKVLPAAFTQNPDRVRRFEREAKAASALNHPNILTIHEIGQVDGTHYIVSEFVAGETLRALIERGRLGISQATAIAEQVAGALGVAHQAGIIHRDIKPGNVMVRPDGLVKVLDFGLAKLTEMKSPPVDSQAPATGKLSTEPGVVMGTASYMSPEQARGQRVDHRTDIFSLGVVLYEMVTERPPFEGVNVIDVMGAILNCEPASLSAQAPTSAEATPAELQRIVSKALCKDRDERYQLVREMLLDLKSLKQELDFEAKLKGVQAFAATDRGQTATAMQKAETATNKMAARRTSSAEYVVGEVKRHPLGAGIVLVTFLAVVTGLAYGLYRPSVQRKSPNRAAGPAPRVVPITSFPGNECCPTFSPDGNQIAFVWDGGKGNNADIYVKLIDTESPVQLTTNPAADTSPVWSPDGRHIAFIRSGKNEQGIYIITALGGSERALYSPPSAGADIASDLAWSPDGKLLAFSERGSPKEPYGIFLLSLESLEKTRMTSLPAGSYGDYAPAFSPDGKTLAFKRALVGKFHCQVYFVPVTGGESERLTDEMTAGIRPHGLAWTPDGREIVFTSRKQLWRVSVSGNMPEPLAAAGNNVFSPAISRHGNRLAYTQYSWDENIWRFEAPSLPDRADAPTRLIASTFYDMSPRYSPDGKKIVFKSARSGSSEIWVCESDGSNPIKLTSFGGPDNGSPRWSPDGRQIAFDGRADGSFGIYVINAGGGNPRRLTAESSAEVRPSWSHDGQWVYFGSNRSGTWQIWKIPAAGGPAVQVTQQGGFEAFESTDGKFLYYTNRFDLNSTSIWRMPMTGGAESQILDQVHQGYWVVLEQGIYFLNTKASPHSTIEFFSFATSRRTQLAVIEKEITLAVPGFAVSPDGRWMLLTLIDLYESDIMLMENFR